MLPNIVNSVSYYLFKPSTEIILLMEILVTYNMQGGNTQFSNLPRNHINIVYAKNNHIVTIFGLKSYDIARSVNNNN